MEKKKTPMMMYQARRLATTLLMPRSRSNSKDSAETVASMATRQPTAPTRNKVAMETGDSIVEAVDVSVEVVEDLVAGAEADLVVDLEEEVLVDSMEVVSIVASLDTRLRNADPDQMIEEIKRESLTSKERLL